MTETKVIDYAWWKPNLALVKSSGYVGIIRYVSRDETKCITAEEIAEAHEMGLAVGVIFEDGATRALAGAAAGTSDAAFANAYLDSIGWPRWKPCGYAVDFQPSAAQMPTILAYVETADRTGPRKGFGYGSTTVVDALVAAGIPDDWQTCAWSNGLVNNKAAIYQRLKPTTGMQGSFDEDVLLHPSNDLWYPGETGSTKKGYAMLVFAQGLDATTALAVCASRRIGVATTSLDEARAAIARGDKVLVLGGPAAEALALTAPTGHPTTTGATTVAIGATADDTLTLACQLIH